MCGSDAIELCPDHCVRFHHPGVGIDLGGIAKGFAVDRAVDALRCHGVTNGVVNAGGDLAVMGSEAHAIHLRDPRDPSRVLCRAAVRNGALAPSGRRFDPFLGATAAGSGVIDPCSRRPIDTIAGATVRALSCMVADALTKVVVIAGESAIALLDHCGASALFVSRDGGIQVTGDWAEAALHAA